MKLSQFTEGQELATAQNLEGIENPILEAIKTQDFQRHSGSEWILCIIISFVFTAGYAFTKTLTLAFALILFFAKIVHIFYTLSCSFILFLIIKCVTKSIIFRRRKIVKEVFCSCRYLICEKPNEIDFPSKKKSPFFPYLSLAHTSEKFDFYPKSNLASFHFILILLYRAIYVIVSEV